MVFMAGEKRKVNYGDSRLPYRSVVGQIKVRGVCCNKMKKWRVVSTEGSGAGGWTKHGQETVLLAGKGTLRVF